MERGQFEPGGCESLCCGLAGREGGSNPLLEGGKEGEMQEAEHAVKATPPQCPMPCG